MPSLVTSDNRIVTPGGRRTWLKRGSQPYSTFFGGGQVELGSLGSVSYTQLFRTQPWVAIAVNKLGRQVARLPLKVYRVDSRGDRGRVRDGSLVALLNRPWERGSANDLKQALVFPTLLHGNGVLAKERSRRGAPPDSLIPLDWRYQRPHFDPGEPIYMWEDTAAKGHRDPADVVHTAWWAPDGPLGVSPLEQLGVTIRHEESARAYSSASFNNAARPSGALVAPREAKFSGDDLREIQAKIRAEHAGPENAFKLLLLSGGFDYKAFGGNAKEAELIEQRKLNREEVAAVYDIPPPLIGILDHATYSNVSEMHRMLYVTVLGPWLNLIESTLQSQLIDPEPAWEGLFVEFDLGEVLKGDPERRIPALTAATGRPIYTLNEARKIENLPAIDGEDANTPLTPTNNMGTIGGETDPDSAAPTLASHLERAQSRVLSRMAAGHADPLDAERFERELAADLLPVTEDASEMAREWTVLLAEGVEAAGSADEIRAVFATLRRRLDEPPPAGVLVPT